MYQRILVACIKDGRLSNANVRHGTTLRSCPARGRASL